LTAPLVFLNVYLLISTVEKGQSWPRSYGSWIYDYLCTRYLSPLMLWGELEPRSGRNIQHFVIKFISDLRQVSGFLRVLRFPPPIKLTATI